MLTQVADGVLIHTSDFCRSNAVVVDGRDGVLLIDPGVTDAEMTCLASDLSELRQPVVAGFSTHPHWDHLLWHLGFGAVPRYGTARCAALIRSRMRDPQFRTRLAGVIPPDIADHVPLDLLGLISGLAEESTIIPWDGPTIRVLEHDAHASGHAALLIEDAGVLVAGDMLSDVLIPILDLTGAADPIEEYLGGLEIIESATDGVDIVIPGHGGVGGADELGRRLDLDRAYLRALEAASGSDGDNVNDPRLEPEAPFGAWVAAVHDTQVHYLTRKRD